MTQQRKFEHKETGWIAIEGHTSPDDKLVMYDFFGVHVGTIPRELVEEGSDWQEITPELVEGRWYVTENLKVGYFWNLRSDEKAELKDCYDIDMQEVDGHLSVDKCRIKREATKEEIHKGLEAIRIEKGFEKGAKIKWVHGAHTISGNTIYDEEKDHLRISVCDGWETLYFKGEWAEKVEDYALVTEDGIKIYNGDRYWYVNRDWKIDKAKAQKGVSYGGGVDSRDFYYRTNAKKYIEEHKPPI